jgi:hypothetical protein
VVVFAAHGHLALHLRVVVILFNVAHLLSCVDGVLVSSEQLALLLLPYLGTWLRIHSHLVGCEHLVVSC